ncbi:hypothetical protein C8J57DRAFT_1636963 [Mycena rebaudengoi]|nr:hypothetical protein C8J57DRAFT_1636963 [Mycena rebaudengoi]
MSDGIKQVQHYLSTFTILAQLVEVFWSPFCHKENLMIADPLKRKWDNQQSSRTSSSPSDFKKKEPRTYVRCLSVARRRKADTVEDEDHDAKTLEPVDPDPAATPPRPPALSWRTRILYLLLMVAVLWLVLQKTGPWFKFRPAASPITTKTLKDGWKRQAAAAKTDQVENEEGEDAVWVEETGDWQEGEGERQVEIPRWDCVGHRYLVSAMLSQYKDETPSISRRKHHLFRRCLAIPAINEEVMVRDVTCGKTVAGQVASRKSPVVVVARLII